MAPVPEPPLPTTMGFPVGQFEGDTLVIRTVGLTDTTVLDASGLPHSDQMVLTERLRVLPDGRLENRMTIEDPDTFTGAWETVLTFHRDPTARVTDDICPDRLARGEPAELLASWPGPCRNATPSRRAKPAAPAVAAPRFTGMWEPKTFGIFVPEAESFTASGKALFDRNAAAMKSGHIMQTAWTSCRPGAVSTMTMPRERILVLESPDEITILYEMPRMVRRIRMGAEHPQRIWSRATLGDSIGRWEGDTLVVDSIGFNGYAELGARGQPTSPQLHTVERFTPAADGSIDIEVTITDPEYYSEPVISNAAGKRTQTGIRSNTTAWRTRGRKTTRIPTSCTSSTGRSASASRAREWSFRRWCALNRVQAALFFDFRHSSSSARSWSIVRPARSFSRRSGGRVACHASVSLTVTSSGRNFRPFASARADLTRPAPAYSPCVGDQIGISLPLNFWASMNFSSTQTTFVPALEIFRLESRSWPMLTLRGGLQRLKLPT